MSTFGTFRNAYFTRYLEIEPEEATFLGFAPGDRALHDPSPEGNERNVNFHRTALSELARSTPQGVDERLDADAIARRSRFAVHAYETASHEANIEVAMLPYAVVQYQATRSSVATENDKDALHARISGIPTFLTRLRKTLRQGLQRGRRLDADIVAEAYERQLSACADFFGRSFTHVLELADAARRAAAAYEEFRVWIGEAVASRAQASICLGADEYSWRMETTLGMRETPGEIVAAAEAMLGTVRRTIGNAGPSASRRAQTPAPESLREAITAYDELVDEARRFVVERGLFEIPLPIDIEFVPTPAGLFSGCAVTNRPAPILGGLGRTQLLISPDPADHVSERCALLAVHEGIPGHALQSSMWRRLFHDYKAPVRFLCSVDDIAIARSYFGAMVSIEGFATYVEELMREHGFYRSEEARFALETQAFRALRVVLDVGVNTGAIAPLEARRRIIAETPFSERIAAAEVLRYRRIPLQALTYVSGAQEFAQLCGSRGEWAGQSLSARHARVLAAGPVPARSLAEAIAFESTPAPAGLDRGCGRV